MPNKQSAKKALRQSKKRALINKEKFAKIRDLKRHFRQAVESNDKNKAQEILKDLSKALDKAAKTKLIKKNTASRHKSRATRKLNKIKQ